MRTKAILTDLVLHKRDSQPVLTFANAQNLTRNEQVSGSSPLVGSLFFDDLQVQREEGKSSELFWSLVHQ